MIVRWMVVICLVVLAGCSIDGPTLPQPEITVEIVPEPGPGCMWVEHDVFIQTIPPDTTLWTVQWLDIDRRLEAGIAEPGEVGEEKLYIPTYQSTVVEVTAWALHGEDAIAYVAANGPEDFQWLWDVPGCEWLRAEDL